MANTGARDGSAESAGSMVGLCLISASTLIVEIALTKFLSFKLFHHMTFAILALVILSFGASGILTFTNPKLFGLKSEKVWHQLGLFAVLYAITLALVIPFFCWLPWTPYDPHLSVVARVASTPLIFLVLALPFFLSGVCISQTLSCSSRPVTVVYFWDLLAAAVGAAACPVILSWLGGYGTMAFSAALGLAGAFGYWSCTGTKRSVGQMGLVIACVVSIAACLFYPGWAIKTQGVDIATLKDIGPQIVARDFNGIKITAWNPVARVDISDTGTSPESNFRWGLSPLTKDQKIYGRYVLLDGGANTRQFRADGDVHEQQYLLTSIWASPYIAKPECKDTLVIGGGGGVDILTGKFFKIPNITVVELNPDIYKLLTGKYDDPQQSYVRWLGSDKYTRVQILNDEARHFATTVKPGTFDVMQASGVDTLTAIQTGGMALTENYLYTVDGIGSYMRMLKPDGILSLTHWRTDKAGTALRMFVTYLSYLDSIGVKDPARHIVVLGGDCCDSLLKGTPFTEEELQRIRDWAKRSQISVVFDPDQKGENINPKQCEHWYATLAFATPEERKKIINANLEIPPAVSDDKPYFYAFRHDSDSWVNLNDDIVPDSLLTMAVTAGIFFLLAPIVSNRRSQITAPLMQSAIYFFVTGFAFLLYETVIIQLFNIFVGGPMYALSVVLVSVLGGYSLGCWVASKLVPSARMFARSGFALAAMFGALYFCVPFITHQLLALPLAARLALCSAITFLCTAAIGITVSSAMEVARRRFGDAVSWMWGVSAVANALGSIGFVPITQATGISSCLLIAGIAYLVGNLMFSANMNAENHASEPIAAQ